MTRVSLMLSAALLLVGCEFSIPSGRFKCEVTADCPPGQSCVDGRCHAGDLDAGMDASRRDAEPARDGGTDGGDAGDAGEAGDSGPQDAGVDAGDSGSIPACDVGSACDGDGGCPHSPLCIVEQTFTVGVTGTDEIVGHPEGASTVSSVSWLEGYCSTTGTRDGDGCNPTDESACGGAGCGVCIATDATGDWTMCVAPCEPNVTDNSDCRDGYQCSLTEGACLPGCQTADDCAIYREDTDGNGVIDDGPAAGGVDRLVYDTTGNWRCNLSTYRCEHDGTAGATAGDSCAKDSDCEANGFCYRGNESTPLGEWSDGYCLKMGCDLPDVSCTGEGVCNERALDYPLCMAPCTVAATAGDRFSNAADCRTGYTCMWDGVSSAAPDNGVCIPGEYNSIRTSNIGSTCTDVSDCYSPYGHGRCTDWDGASGPAVATCTMIDCAAPGIPVDVCGSGGVCARVSPTSWCVDACTAAEECAEGYGCWDTTVAGLDTGGQLICFPGCLEDADCRAGETCVGASTTSLGTCG